MFKPELPETKNLILDIFQDLKKTREKLNKNIEALHEKAEEIDSNKAKVVRILNDLGVIEIPHSYWRNLYKLKLKKYDSEIKKHIIEFNKLEQLRFAVSRDIDLLQEVLDKHEVGYKFVARETEVKLIGGVGHTDIGELDIQILISRLLKENNIKTFEALKQTSDKDLLDIKGFGKTLLAELKEAKSRFPYFKN
jgi:Bacterial RNA polymerase, alpha chain C terminal domain